MSLQTLIYKKAVAKEAALVQMRDTAAGAVKLVRDAQRNSTPEKTAKLAEAEAGLSRERITIEKHLNAATREREAAAAAIRWSPVK
ncbi:MAG: hypothetical protein ACHQPI_02930 [Thermoanaerobaculia bacterium]